MKEKLLSVIMPAYNCDKYIKKAIESVISQKYKKLELIIIDDGSTDNTGDICNQYANKDDRIKVIHIPNHGVSYARNLGLKLSNGDFIAFIDSDDWIDQEMYLKMMNAFESSIDIVVCDFQEEYEEGCEKKLKRSNFIAGVYDSITALDLLNRNGYLWNKIYRKDILSSIKFLEEIKIEEDWIFNIKAFSKASKIKFLGKRYYHYLQRINSTLHSKNFRDVIATLKEINRMLDTSSVNMNKKLCSVLKHEYNAIVLYSMIWSLSDRNGQEYFQSMRSTIDIKSIFNDNIFSLKDKMIYIFINIFPYNFVQYTWLLKNK